MSDSSVVRARLRELFARGAAAPLSDDEFNQLALAVFRHQFDNNKAYHAYCRRRARTPDNVRDWRSIPAVPTAAFKEIDLVAGEAEKAVLVFQTSGTTRGAERRGRHYLLDPELYRASLLAGFKEFVLHGSERMLMYSIMPSAKELTDSSLAFMIDEVIDKFGSAGSRIFATVARGVDVPALSVALRSAKEPVCLLGTSLAYLHWLEENQETFALPRGSRLMDTGGFKGEAREITPSQLRTWYERTLAIPPELCFNEYGMTELCSQFYSSADFIKRGPAWLRFRVLDPDTLEEVPQGEQGILQHFDLANVDSVSAVLTEDLARVVDGGFVLEGRAPGAMPRGCSIAMDILLEDARKK